MTNGGDQNGNTGLPPMESKFVQYHLYIAFYTPRRPQNLRKSSAEVSLRQYTTGNARPCHDIVCQKASRSFIHRHKKREKTISFPHRLSRFLWTSYRNCKRAGLTKGVNRPPGPPIYQALMLNASRVSSIRETVCIAS